MGQVLSGAKDLQPGAFRGGEQKNTSDRKFRDPKSPNSPDFVESTYDLSIKNTLEHGQTQKTDGFLFVERGTAILKVTIFIENAVFGYETPL